ncbi:MAG: double zinc ribbon domain-containing protein [Actinomycetota bacterium]
MPLPGLDLLFPVRCAGCRAGPWPFCAVCRRTLVPFAPPWCVRCGVPLERYAEACPNCPPVVLARTRSAFLFEGAARSAVHRLKFSGWRPVAAALATAMAAGADGFAADHVVTWIPLSRRRRRHRGFDQAELLARAFAAERGIGAVPLLQRVRDSGPQAKRGGEARRSALRGAFALARPAPERVLLVDDVLTTGSTAAACANVLLRGGAREVMLLTAARSVRARLPSRYTRHGLAPGSVVAREDVSR